MQYEALGWLAGGLGLLGLIGTAASFRSQDAPFVSPPRPPPPPPPLLLPLRGPALPAGGISLRPVLLKSLPGASVEHSKNLGLGHIQDFQILICMLQLQKPSSPCYASSSSSIVTWPSSALIGSCCRLHQHILRISSYGSGCASPPSPDLHTLLHVSHLSERLHEVGQHSDPMYARYLVPTRSIASCQHRMQFSIYQRMNRTKARVMLRVQEVLRCNNICFNISHHMDMCRPLALVTWEVWACSSGLRLWCRVACCLPCTSLRLFHP